MTASFFALLLSAVPGLGEEKGGCEVAVAAFELPPGSNGLLPWRDGDGATTPIQLSKRYFSEPVKFKTRAIRFHRDPWVPSESQQCSSHPLRSLNDHPYAPVA